MKSSTWKKIIILGLIAALVVVFFAFDLKQFLTLDYIKSQQVRFTRLYEANQLTMLAAYFAIYILVTGLSLPGAAVLTLAGGGLFGFWATLIVVSFASSIGATLACAVARFLLRDWVQRKFGDKLSAINKGIETEGAFYLFTLRLIPVFPFFIINLVMGLTPIKLFTFYWVSQVGMLAGTAVFVNAGRELGRLDSLSGILSPGLIISFVLLGLFPLAAKKAIAFYRKRSGTAKGK